MTKQEKKEMLYGFYKKVYKTNEEPDLLGLVSFVNTLGNALWCHDAEKELGTDIYELVKKCVKVKKRGSSVDVSLLFNEIGYYDKD